MFHAEGLKKQKPKNRKTETQTTTVFYPTLVLQQLVLLRVSPTNLNEYYGCGVVCA